MKISPAVKLGAILCGTYATLQQLGQVATPNRPTFSHAVFDIGMNALAGAVILGGCVGLAKKVGCVAFGAFVGGIGWLMIGLPKCKGLMKSASEGTTDIEAQCFLGYCGCVVMAGGAIVGALGGKAVTLIGQIFIECLTKEVKK